MCPGIEGREMKKGHGVFDLGKIVEFYSFDEFLAEIKLRVEAGASLESEDNPRTRHIGFVDKDTGESFKVGLRYIKGWGGGDDEPAGSQAQRIREAIRYPAGRAFLLTEAFWSGDPLPSDDIDTGRNPNSDWRAVIRPDSLDSYLKTMRARALEGHSLLLADDPSQLLVGFVDVTAQEIVYLNLHRLKQGSQTLKSGIGLRVKEAISMSEGRASMLTRDFWVTNEGES